MTGSGSGWSRDELGLLCDVRIGRTPARGRREYWADGVHPWLSIADLNASVVVKTTRECISERAASEAAAPALPAGTLVMSFKLSVGKLAFLGRPMRTNEAIAGLIPKDPERLHTRYLYHWLRNRDFAGSTDRAAKGLTLNKPKIEAIPVERPSSTDEQRRIAAILDKADAVRARRVAALRDADVLIKAEFLHRFGSPLTNPKELPRSPLSDLGRVVTGNTPSRGVADYYGPGIEWIKSDNINTPGHILTRASEHLSAAGEAVGRTAPMGSVLVTCIAGSPDCIGNAAIADRPVAFNQQINAIIPHDPRDTGFIYGHLLVGKKLIQLASTNSMKGMVAKSQFERIPFLFPDPDQRRAFSKVLNALIAMREAAARGVADADALYASLAARAFQGRL